jgi:methylmalonyl-CoA/ethylmalonyl-CoA epimerase
MDNMFTYHHVGIAVRDLESAIPAYERLFGYKLISGPFSDPIQNVSVCFMSRGNGDPVIELVAPLGPNSPIDRILKKGGGAYHLCYQVKDLRKAIDELKTQGSFLLGEPVPGVAFEMREIAWLMTDEASLLVELVQA